MKEYPNRENDCSLNVQYYSICKTVLIISGCCIDVLIILD